MIINGLVSAYGFYLCIADGNDNSLLCLFANSNVLIDHVYINLYIYIYNDVEKKQVKFGWILYLTNMTYELDENA